MLGDILDCEEFYFKSDEFKRAKKDKDFDGFFVPAIEAEVEFFEKLLDLLRPLVYDYKNIWFFEGNHEERLRRDKFTCFIPDKYHTCFDLPLQLQLKRRGIHFIKYRNWAQISTKSGNLALTHGDYCGANPIKKHIDVAHMPVLFGHTHEVGRRSFKTLEGNFIGYNNACMCDQNMPYMENKAHNWSTGFSTIQVTEDNYWVNQFEIKNGVLLDAHGRKI